MGKAETPEQAAELGALRDPGDLTTTGDRPAFQPDAPPNGSEEDTSDGLDIMLDVLGGASGAYANDVIDYAKGMVIFATFPPGYFMWQGYNFWGGLANGAVQGYEQDGVFGALAGAVNTLNPLALVGISLAATVDSAEKGDYAKAGEHGYQAAKVLAGIALGAIGAGIKLGSAKSPAGPIRSSNWHPRDIKNPACATGCERAATQIQKHIGGDIKRITPISGAPTLGGYRGQNWGWSHHEVVVKGGRVYDAFTGGKGASIAEYKALWEYSGHINFGF
ncbi:MAG: hypothetical protein IPM54_17355 [Polyangiaceae bacterium]|nr:hypothetical protein [Polyangiaceae bacterium]